MRNQETGANSLADAGVSLMDAFSDYVTSLLKLQGFRLKAEARSVLRRLALYLTGFALATFGFILLSYGLVLWLASQVRSLAGSFWIVGFAYLLLGVLGMLALAKARHAPNPRPQRLHAHLEVPDA